MNAETTHAHHEKISDASSHHHHAGEKHAGKHVPSRKHGMDGPAEQGGHHVDHSGHERMFRDRFWVSLALTLPVLLYSPVVQAWLGFTLPAFPGSRWITPVFSVVIFYYGGLPFLRMAVPELRNRQPGMMTLITLVISTSFLYSLAALFFSLGEGFFWELVTLIDVMLLGHWLEMRSVRQASRALDELAKLMPDTAERIRKDGSLETVPVSQLHTGDRVLVRPGASIPADGEVIEGESRINEALITGESKLVKKSPDEKVIAGSINGDGSLRVAVSAVGEETALAGIMRLVTDAQQSKSRSQVLADKAAAWLFYIAVVVAVLTGIGWGFSIGFGLFALQRVVSVLVIACPHALGLAIPLVVSISTSSAAMNGILIRDRLALETARDIDVVVFDKTGTLTTGQQGVVDFALADGWSEEQALALAAAIEADSEHNIARGIRLAAEERNLPLPVVNEFEAIKGHGVRAQHNEHEVYVGGPRLLEKLELEPNDALAGFSQTAGAKGQTVVYLVSDGTAVAAFALADVIRQESYRAVKELSSMEIEVAMLTGDSQDVAGAAADELGINIFFAEVLPEHKDQKIIELQRQGKRVAMVGDGVNDAPALVRADVGIAIGSGTDVAVESAGIILVKSNPLDVVKIFKLSRASYSKMLQNLAWATGYNVIAIPLAAGVLASLGILLSPALGALAMSLSTVIVAINAQFLRRLQLGA